MYVSTCGSNLPRYAFARMRIQRSRWMGRGLAKKLLRQPLDVMHHAVDGPEVGDVAGLNMGGLIAECRRLAHSARAPQAQNECDDWRRPQLVAEAKHHPVVLLPPCGCTGHVRVDAPLVLGPARMGGLTSKSNCCQRSLAPSGDVAVLGGSAIGEFLAGQKEYLCAALARK